MNIKKILEIVKKNLFSFICALIAIAAVVATYWPLGGLMTGLQALADGRASVYTQLDSLYSQPRKLPLTDPSKTTQDDLTQFPNAKTLEEGQLATNNVRDQSVNMVTFVKTLNAKGHTPLVDQVLPVALSPTAKFHFGDVYKLALSIDPAESITTDPKLKEANQPNLRNDILNGGIPPTDADIAAAQKDLWDNDFAFKVISQNGAEKNRPQIQALYNEASVKLPDAMKMDVATKKKVYVAADAFAINNSVTGTLEPVATDIWFSQLTLWIQQDIANAIAQTNAKSKNILDAPVKQLVRLSIPMSPTPYTGVSVTAVGAPPTPVDGGDTQVLQKNLTVSATGRISNPMYDVVQFTLVVKVDASQIPAFIETLGQDRLIDVYNLNQVSVDPTDSRQAGFIFGPMPVVQLTLNCEALFLRQWSAPLMPDPIKKILNISTAAPVPGVAQ